MLKLLTIVISLSGRYDNVQRDDDDTTYTPAVTVLEVRILYTGRTLKHLNVNLFTAKDVCIVKFARKLA